MKSETFEPKRATFGSCGYDLYSPREYELIPGKWTLIDTGVRLEDTDKVTFDFVEARHELGYNVYKSHKLRSTKWLMMMFPRSGLSDKFGLRFRTTAGIIDMDYRDTIKARVTVEEPYTLEYGERFGQAILLPFGTFESEIKPTEYRKGGFGSTGKV